MELEDSAFELLAGVETTSDLKTAFEGTSWALLVGSVPRKAGMERKDLLSVNGGIFGPQGAALAAHAASDIRVLVVGNPCNTNCLIARSHAPEVPDDRWFSMTRLDQNRAATALALRAGVPVASVKHVAIWGNHSSTQFPDFENVRIEGRPATEVIGDEQWLRGEFIGHIQQRGAKVMQARGASSAAFGGQRRDRLGTQPPQPHPRRGLRFARRLVARRVPQTRRDRLRVPDHLRRHELAGSGGPRAQPLCLRAHRDHHRRAPLGALGRRGPAPYLTIRRTFTRSCPSGLVEGGELLGAPFATRCRPSRTSRRHRRTPPGREPRPALVRIVTIVRSHRAK